jgi:hypothetical protein
MSKDLEGKNLSDLVDVIVQFQQTPTRVHVGKVQGWDGLKAEHFAVRSNSKEQDCDETKFKMDSDFHWVDADSSSCGLELCAGPFAPDIPSRVPGISSELRGRRRGSRGLD